MGIQDVAGVVRATNSMNVASSSSRETSKEETLDKVSLPSNGVNSVLAIQKALATAALKGENVDLDSCLVSDSFLSTSMAIERINFTSRAILSQAQNAVSAQTTNLSAQMVSTLQA